MRRSHYLLSFMLSRLVWLVLEVVVVIGAGWVLFGVGVHGSFIDLAVIALLGAAAFAGLGLLVAARPQTIEGVSGWMNLVMLPMWLASGTFFSYERFPRALVGVIRVLPLTAVNDALRAVMNEGASLAAVWYPVVVLVVWCVVSFGVALRLFRWQ
jgi:ABC-type multidrug transport system permease subunit